MKDAVRAGPEGWWEWADDLRNTLVHRARRFEANMYDGKQDKVMVCPLPRHQKQTDAEARARSGRQLGEYLDEDAGVTVAGILEVTALACRRDGHGEHMVIVSSVHAAGREDLVAARVGSTSNAPTLVAVAEQAELAQWP
ncbi:hypothetical protein [Streptomyces decoyicus]|uniref:hypothetical protein n=1 Tax=Streptomyces decoyicus TaxID=249567 RepID=UPI0033A45A85